MDTFAEIADERRSLAAGMSGLTGEQQATQSLCSEWSVPLGLPRDIPEERLHKSLTFLTAAPVGGFVSKGTLGGLRFEANDIDWAHGSGPTVSGHAEALLLAITGRTTALGHLSGDGVSTLRSRLA